MRTVAATRYLAPLREGGSLPAIVDASDGETYVVKFRGAGQGAPALLAEIVTGEIARHLGLPVPELVLVEIDPLLARSEPDGEIRDLVRASAGLNVGMRYLPGAVGWEPPLPGPPDARLAADVVWLDGFTLNVDRTPRNPNLLLWRGGLWLIDHGASLYFQHDWAGREGKVRSPFAAIRQHALLPRAGSIHAADARLAPLLDEQRLGAVLSQVPDAWLDAEGDPGRTRAAFVDFLRARLAAPRDFVEEAERARALHV